MPAAPYNRLDRSSYGYRGYDGVSIGSDPTGEVKFSGTVDSGRTNTSQLSDGTATLNPVNRTCMLATTIPVTNEKKSIAENLDLSKSPQAGSGLVVLPPHTTREVTPTNILRNAVLMVRTPH